MIFTTTKSRLTITLDKDLHTKSKKICKERHIKLSGVIENFLEYFANPYVYCFKCGEKFSTHNGEVCPKCTWIRCPACNTCGCELSEDVSKAIYPMRKVYEDLLQGRLKD